MTDKQMKVGKEQEALLDALIAGCESPEDILGQHGLLKELQKRLMERALKAANSPPVDGRAVEFQGTGHCPLHNEWAGRRKRALVRR